MQICICRIRVEEWIKISDLLFFQEGPGVRNTQYTQSGVKLLNVANLVNGKVDLSTSDRYISEDEAYGRYKHFLCDDGDFIIASSGIKVEYFDRKMGFVDSSMLPLCMNTSTIRFKVIDSKRLNIKYFMYYLKSIHFKQQLSKFITGSAQLNFGPSHLKKMNMPLVSLKEQNDIVEKLSKVELLLDKYNGEIKLLDELIKARFVEMFGDPVINSYQLPVQSMTDICDIIDGDRGKNYPKAEDILDSGYCLFLNAKNVTQKGFDFESCNFITREKDDALRKGKLSRGDVVLTTRGTVGNLAYYSEDIPYENIRINSGMVILRMNRNILNEIYFIELFKMKLSDIKEKNASGSAQPQLPISTMNKIILLIPPLELQNQFASFVQEIDKSRLRELLAIKQIKLLLHDSWFLFY